MRRSIERQPQPARQNLDLLTRVCRNERLSCPQTAYVLATAFHESRLGLWMVDHRLGDGDRYRGRGFAPLAGRAAYATFGRRLDLPLLTRPDLAARPEIAARILVRGMKLGLFTGRRLDEDIDDRRVDYVAARAVMDPSDRAVRVAGYARAFEAHLEGRDAAEPTSSDVGQAQRHLATIGWPLAADGHLGPLTARAIRDFQAGYCLAELPVDGSLEPITSLAIESCAAHDGFASDHFRFAEFRTAGSAELGARNRVIRVERALLEALETYRRAVGRPVGIACGYRSIEHNAAVGGRADSEHLVGRAVHVRTPELAVNAVRRLGAFGSIGHRSGLAVHLGVPVHATPDRPRVYSLEGEAAASPPSPILDRALGSATDSGGPLADAGHRSRPRLPVGAGIGSGRHRPEPDHRD